MRLYFDIESIPSQAPDARDLVRATIKPPATYKKAETIAKWWEEDAPAAIEEAYRKQALDATSGELITAIAYAFIVNPSKNSFTVMDLRRVL
jgi:hypothetical protein